MICRHTATQPTILLGGLINDVLQNNGLLRTSQQPGKHSNGNVRLCTPPAIFTGQESSTTSTDWLKDPANSAAV
jgi:hypothetical protein